MPDTHQPGLHPADPHLFALPPGLAALTTLVRDCSVSGVARQVLLLRTDLLDTHPGSGPGARPAARPGARSGHLARLRDALEPLAAAERGRLHELGHDRLAVSWRGDAPDRLRRTLEAIEAVLGGNPLDGPALPELARLFALPRDGAALLALATDPPGRIGSDPAAPDAPLPYVPPPPRPRPPLDPASLGLMETRLAAANVARFARRRIVCRLGNDRFTPAWETRYLNVAELMSELAPDRNAFADPWLFRRLTRMFDRRMLALLTTKAELHEAGPFSLDLNVGGVLSPEFIRFDATLPAALRGQAVLALHPADIMADLPTFTFARAYARARGYRILMRALGPTLIPLLDLAALELDFVELRWTPALTALDPGALRAGTARWLLSRADGPDAVHWGRSVGIGLFQGDAVRPGPLPPLHGPP